MTEDLILFHALRPGKTEEKWRGIARNNPVGPHEYSRKKISLMIQPGEWVVLAMNRKDLRVVRGYVLQRQKTGKDLMLDTLVLTSIEECL